MSTAPSQHATPGNMGKSRQRFEHLVKEALPSPASPVADLTSRQRILVARAQGKHLVAEMSQGRLPATQVLTAVLDKVDLEDSAHQLSPDGQQVASSLDRLVKSTKALLEEKNDQDQFQRTVAHLRRAQINLAKSKCLGKTNSEAQGADVVASHVQDPDREEVVAVAESVQDTPTLDPAVKASPRELSVREACDQAVDALRDTRQSAIKIGMDAMAPYANGIRDGSVEISDAARQATGDLARTVRQGLATTNLTPPQKDGLIASFKGIVLAVQKNPDCQAAIEELLDLLTEFRRHLAESGRRIRQQGEAHTSEDSDLHLALANARQLLENFANGHSTQALYDALVGFYSSVREDPQADGVLRDTKLFISNCLRNHAYIESDQYRADADNLLERSRKVFSDQHGLASASIGSAMQDLLEGFRQDTTTRQWRADLNGLFREAFLDETGKPTVKRGLVLDALKALPQIVQAIRFLPLHRLEFANDAYEYAIDNLFISLSQILPTNVTVVTHTDIDFGAYGQDLAGTVVQRARAARRGVREKVSTVGSSTPSHATSSLAGSQADLNTRTGSELDHEVAIGIKNVVCTAHNAVFYFKKKTGFPKWADVGHANLMMSDHRGLDLRIVVRVGNPGSTGRALTVVKVEPHLRSLKLKLKDTKHDTLYKTLGPLINRTLRRRVQDAIKVRIENFLGMVDTRIVHGARSVRQAAIQRPVVAQSTAKEVVEPMIPMLEKLDEPELTSLGDLSTQLEQIAETTVADTLPATTGSVPLPLAGAQRKPLPLSMDEDS
ncbi:hypothetical protein IWQ60_002956 [Tieghemiomyces parasiticus]|uniref:Uncharacterized protein n=1 Tax=Tieghemiomyces parasiticus TaxID=78921 RepID=A0A9W8E0I1_9FUNG|nr:hypothetical protein IWQ60_002956 [Tieghemiomyces parasiticus]